MTLRNALTVIAWLSAAAAAALFAVRMDSAVSFVEPLHVITSGYEQQPLMGIWRSVHGLPVYTDYFSPPYYSGYYNWMFYELYGTAVKAVMAVFNLGDEWIPTIARSVTFFIYTFIFVLARRTCIVFSGAQGRADKLFCGAFAAVAVFGPLTGFWGITARPDAARLFLEIAAVLVFWNAGKPAVRAVIFAALLCYAAWAVKHSAVVAPVALVIYCAVERRIRDAALFSGILIVLFGATFALQSEYYLSSLLQGPQPFSLEYGIRSFVNFAQKSTPQIFGAAALIFSCLFLRAARAEILKTPEIRYTGVYAITAFVFSASTASIEMGAESYYFTASYALTALIAAAFGALKPARHIMTALFAGFLLQIAAIAWVFAGRAGVLSVADVHESHKSAQACMAALPQPVYAAEQYLQLPWMTPGTPMAFPTVNYSAHRAAGREFEKGGVGGLIESGAFGALYVSGEPDAPIDGARLSRYVRDEKPCAGRWIYRRKPQP